MDRKDLKEAEKAGWAAQRTTCRAKIAVQSWDHRVKKVFTKNNKNLWGGGIRERWRGIKWTAHERRTGEDRGIPRWHLISLSLLLFFSPFPSFFSPNKSFWLLLNQLIPSRQRENCNNLPFSTPPPVSFSVWLPLSFSFTHTRAHRHSHTHLKCIVCALEVMEGANYWTLELLRAFPTHMNILGGIKTQNLKCCHNHSVIHNTQSWLLLTFPMCVNCFRSKTDVLRIASVRFRLSKTLEHNCDSFYAMIHIKKYYE